MSFIKYRIHEVAKDFGMPTKTMMELFEKHFGKPKNHMQVLDDHQLNVIFDVITQQRQIDSLERVFAVAPAPKAEAPKAAPAPQEEKKPQQKEQPKDARRPEAQNRPRQGQNPTQGAQGEARKKNPQP